MIRRIPAMLHPYCLLLAAVCGLFWTTDWLGAPPSSDGSDDGDASCRFGSCRTFVLVVDSLRYETAIDKEIMPELAALSADAVHAELATTYDAVTRPALRAALVGSDRVQAFGAVTNLVSTGQTVDSLLTRAAAAGLRTEAFHEGEFDQFGASMHSHFPNEKGGGTLPDKQDRAVHSALARFGSQDVDVMFAMVDYTDHTTHAHGAKSPAYKEAFGRVDELIAFAARTLPPDATLIVFGDHGHTDAGGHMPGMDLPSVLIVRGPAFHGGVDLGRVPITEVRYFLGWSLGLPLQDYPGPRHPDALRDPTGAYAESVTPSQVERQQHLQPWHYPLLAGFLGLWFGLWWIFVREGPKGAVGAWLLWVGPGALAIPFAFPFGVLVAAAVLLAGIARAPPLRRPTTLGWLGAATALGVGLYAWGFAFEDFPFSVHEPSIFTMHARWAGLCVLGVLLTHRYGLGLAAAVTLMPPLLLGYPSAFRTAAMGVAGPGMLCLLAYVATAISRPTTTRQWAELIGRLLLAAVLVQFLMYPEANKGRFIGWLPLVDAIAPTHVIAWFVWASIAKMVVFLRPKAPATIRIAGIFATAYTIAVQFELVPREGAHSLPIVLGALALFAATTWARKEGRIRSDDIPQLAGFFAAFCVYYHLTRVDLELTITVDTGLAACFLVAAVVRRHGGPRLIASTRIALLLLGVLFAGWGTLAWRFRHLEWNFLYTLASPPTVLEYAVPLIPVIAARYLAPVLLFRALVTRELGRPDPNGRSIAWRAAGLKLVAGALLASGIGHHTPSGTVYLDATQETIVLATLLAGIL